MKLLAFSLLTLVSVSTMAETKSSQAQMLSDVGTVTADLVSEIINEYGLVPAAQDEETMSVTIDLTAQKCDPPCKDRSFFSKLELSPTIGLSMGSSQMGIINFSAGLDSKYITGDFTVGFGSVSDENIAGYSGAEFNLITHDYKVSHSARTISGALRLKLFEYLEVGVRYADQQYSRTMIVKESYLATLKSWGYDVRVNLPLQGEGSKLAGTITISGLKKDSLAPNYIQVGARYKFL